MTAIAAIALVASASPALASPPDSGGGLVPFGTAPALPNGASLLGAVSADENISFDVVLKPRNQAALDAFVQQVSTPGSPQYRKFLKKGEFGPRFGATQTSIAAVTRSFKSMGLTVDSVSSSGLLVNVSGSAEKVGKALHTSFRQVRLKSGRIARANSAAPRLPSTISPAVQSVFGLDTMLQLQHAATRSSSMAEPALPAKAQKPNMVSCPGGGSNYYLPSQLASYYGLDSVGSDGAGVTVALFELEPFSSTDISTYKTCFTSTGSITTIQVGVGAGTGPGSGEAALDIEDVIGLAPAADILVYEAPNPSGILDEYQQIADDNLADIVSTSWGLCESSSGTSFMQSERAIFQQMATQGQTVLAASGDSGSEGCYYPYPPVFDFSTALAVSDPASQPEVTGVGGTNLKTATGSEDVWNERSTGHGAGGGGVSTQWEMPPWQQPLGIITGQSMKSCGNSNTSYCREVPDVSASADPLHGYLVYYSDPDAGSDWYIYGGTSAAAPTWASLLARIQDSCGGSRLGLINPALYKLESAGVFNDIATGASNDYTGNHPGKYTTRLHYDMATGLGSPKGDSLAAELCPATDGAGTAKADPSAVPISTRQTLTFTYTAPLTQSLVDGTLSVEVPPIADGWAAPSTSPTADGYTTASAGVVSVSGQVITVSDLSTLAGGTVTITYGDKTRGGVGVKTPPNKATWAFAVQSTATSGGTPSPLTSGSPTVLVGTATDGSGTMTVTPTPATVSSGNQPTTLTFQYTPPAGTGLTNGEIDVSVPTGWPLPSLAATEPGYVTTSGASSPPTLSVAGSTIRVSAVNLDVTVNHTLTITYGDTTGGGPGATAPPTGGPSVFATTQMATSTGTLKPVMPTPQIVVQGPAANGSGTMGVTSTPATVIAGSRTTLNFTYTPPQGATVTGGEITVLVPTDWTQPSMVLGEPGQVTISGGGATSVAINAVTGGWLIDVTSVTLAAGDTLGIAYGDVSGDTSGAATAPSTAKPYTFTTSMVNGAGTPVPLATSPSLTVQSPPPPPSSGGSPVGHPTLQRVYGSDRITTSIAASKAAFPNDSSAHVVVLARSDSYADALAGTPLAAAKNGPLLLTLSTSLPDPVVGEIGRVLPIGGTIYILGGTAAINSSIQSELTGFGYSVQRLAGNSRYETAVAIAAALGNPSTVFEADGTNFPDALSAGSAAVHEGGVVLLTSGTTMPAATAAYLVAHPSTRYTIGGPAAKADPGAQGFVGADRYATSVLVAQRFFQAPISVGLASGQTFPDALSGGVVASLNTGPMILVPKSGNVPSGTLSYLTFAGNSASKAWLFGGTASVEDVVFLQAADALKPGSTTTVVG